MALVLMAGVERTIGPNRSALRITNEAGTIVFQLNADGTISSTLGLAAVTATTVAASTSVKTPALDGVAPTAAGLTIGALGTSKLGFYGHAVVAQQTGVTVDAAGIHAALVALGLFTA